MSLNHALRLIGTLCTRSNIKLRISSNILQPQTVLRISACRKSRWARPMTAELYRRRLEQGPEPDRHRSESPNWNYDSELFGFGKRLQEEFNENTLRTAFIHRSYIAMEEARRAKLEMTEETEALELDHNEHLATEGEEFAIRFISKHLRTELPRLPEQGIRSITDYLTTDEMLAYIGKNLGIADLIMCEELKPSVATLSLSFKAVIGALLKDQGTTRAGLFVRDFIVTQLTGKEMSELWPVDDPMGLLVDVMKEKKQALPEPRLLGEAGSQTMVAAYVVGIYSDRKLIGKAPGETVSIAEEMAARDALKNMFGLQLSRDSLSYGKGLNKPQSVTQGSNTSRS